MTDYDRAKNEALRRQVNEWSKLIYNETVSNQFSCKPYEGPNFAYLSGILTS